MSATRLFSQYRLYIASARLLMLGRFALAFFALLMLLLFWFPREGAIVHPPKWWGLLLCFLMALWFITIFLAVLLAASLKCDACGRRPTIVWGINYKEPYSPGRGSRAILNFLYPLELQIRRFRCAHCRTEFTLDGNVKGHEWYEPTSLPPEKSSGPCGSEHQGNQYVMMKKTELLKNIALQRRYASWCARLGSLSIILLISVVVYTRRNYEYLYQSHPILSWISPALFCAIVIVTFWAMFRNFGKVGLICPNCHKALDKHLSDIALTTLKCGKCGRTIVEDE